MINGIKFKQWDGSLMFAEQYEVMLTDYTAGAEIHINGEAWTPGGGKAVFAAGLHDVRILSPSDEENEPRFDFEIRSPITDESREIRVTPSMLYSIPVRGWIHTAHPADEPSRMIYFEVEPFIFYNGIWERRGNLAGRNMVHEWKSRSRLKVGDILPLHVSWLAGDVEVFVDGKAVPQDPGRKVIAFQLEGTGEEQTVLIRRVGPGGHLQFKLLHDGRESPPYEVFYPSAGERFRYDGEEIGAENEGV